MSRVFHLSHMLDEHGYNRIDLITFDELSKLDEFTSHFKDSKGVVAMFNEPIGEFCLNNMKEIKRENRKNKRNWTGSIAIICEEKKPDQKSEIFKIGVIYKNDRRLLPKKDCINKIRELLVTKRKHPELMLEVYDRKKPLLSDNEIGLIEDYQNTNDIGYLNSAAGFFFNRIKVYDDELLYMYCRSIMNIFRLNELSIKTQFGNIKHIGPVIPIHTMLVKDSKKADPYLLDVIHGKNYSELYTLYTLDQLYAQSDYIESKTRMLVDPIPREEDIIYIDDDSKEKGSKQ